ncbi:MAG: AMP-binding protein, partial [Pseudomonadota bacterium]
VDGRVQYSYEDLKRRVQLVAAHLKPALRAGRVGVLGSRSAEACIGFLGTGWAGGTYVPLGLSQPEARLIALLERLELDALIVDKAGAKLLSPALRRAAPDLILAPDGATGKVHPIGKTGTTEIAQMLPEPAEVSPDHLAYIIFTSGTTGMPKGVMVSSRSIGLYLDAIEPWYRLTPNDRAAETCETSFDLSIHNMMTAWRAGAALCIMRPLDLVAPARFIRAHQITTWLSVPSIIALMRQAGTLTPGSLPSLRLCWFCGEPLSAQAVREWAQAAPNAVIENFYGPTEITIAVLRQRWNGNGPITPSRGIVAIGKPIAGIDVLIVDEQRKPVPIGTPGEIVLAGEQCADGYFRMPDLTAERFPVINGKPGYMTGDRGYMDEKGVFHHLGRLDNQIKFKGHRIELEEIDAKLREAAGAEMVGTVTWPMHGDMVGGLAGFFTKPGLDADAVRRKLRALLPPHMVPDHLENLDDMPLSANGKVDRKALIALLDRRQKAKAVA